jgi:hypothetical protein
MLPSVLKYLNNNRPVTMPFLNSSPETHLIPEVFSCHSSGEMGSTLLALQSEVRRLRWPNFLDKQRPPVLMTLLHG